MQRAGGEQALRWTGAQETGHRQAAGMQEMGPGRQTGMQKTGGNRHAGGGRHTGMQEAGCIHG